MCAMEHTNHSGGLDDSQNLTRVPIIMSEPSFYFKGVF